MVTKDVVRAQSRFIAGARRIVAGIERQRERIEQRRAGAPRLLEGTPHETVVFSTDGDNDLDYYVYELFRLRDLTCEAIKAFGKPQELVDARDAFDAAVPKLREIRNALTHTSDDARLDDVAWFDAHIRLNPDLSAEYLVDSRYQHHDAALALGEAVLAYLRRGLQQSEP